MKEVRNQQITKISARNLEKPSNKEQFDSTFEERDRTYETRQPEPRFTEYR